jgi:putative intracellular protease/amidase
MKILMVLTSHSELGNTGKKTGLWLEEFAAPYFVFRDEGADIALASPREDSLRSIRRARSPDRRQTPLNASSEMPARRRRSQQR